MSATAQLPFEVGPWYREVPKDFQENLEFRQRLLGKCNRSRQNQRLVREACKEDILFFVNSVCWTYDPRLEGTKAVPFITYEYQDRVLLSICRAVKKQKSLVLQKSRDMGATWKCVLVMDWLAQFQRMCKFLMLSRKAEMVDSAGDSDCLFWKIDFIHRHLPRFVLDAEKDVVRRLMRFHYLKTDSQVTGSTTTDTSGIGGRSTAIFIDEYSRYDVKDARTLKSGLADTSPCRIWNFTPNPEIGDAHPSYDLVVQVEKGDIDGERMHWREHPEKARGLYFVDRKKLRVEVIDKGYKFQPDYKYQTDGVFEWHSPWFDKERIERGNDRDIFEMLEIDYQRSTHTVFDTMQIKDYIIEFCRPPYIEGDLVYDEESGRPIRFERGANGPIKLWTELDENDNPPVAFYVAGADVSYGKGATNSCFSAGRCDTREKVLELAVATMVPIAFATKCVAICRWLSSPGKSCKLSWEKQGPGETFGDYVLTRLNYHNVYMKKSGWAFEIRETKIAGWPPTSKADLLEKYRTGLSKREFMNRSELAMRETLDYIRTATGVEHKANSNRKADPSGATVNHGDRVIADGQCYMLMMERAGNTAEAEESRILPGSVAWLMREEMRDEGMKGVLYPNWNRRRR